MKEIEELRSQISRLRKQMTSTAQKLTTISGRLLSGEIINQSEYDDTVNVIARLRDIQSDFCEKLLKLSGGEAMPGALDAAEQMISQAEVKLNKAPLYELIDELKRITTPEDPRGAAAVRLSELIGDVEKMCGNDAEIGDVSSAVLPYERFVSAVKCGDYSQRRTMLKDFRSNFSADLINDVLFGEFEYGDAPKAASGEKAAASSDKSEAVSDRSGGIEAKTGVRKTVDETTGETAEKNAGKPAEKASDVQLVSEDTYAPKPWTLEQEDLYLPDRDKITDDDRKRLEKLKEFGIAIGVRKCPFKYEICRGDEAPALKKRVKKDLEKYSGANLNAAMKFGSRSVAVPEEFNNKYDGSLKSLSELGYLYSVTREGKSPMYFLSAKGANAFPSVTGFSKDETAKLKNTINYKLDDDLFDGCVCAENNIMAEYGLTVLRLKLHNAQRVIIPAHSESRCRMGCASRSVKKGDSQTDLSHFILSFAAASDESTLQVIKYIDQQLSQIRCDTVMIAAYDLNECEILYRYIKEYYSENITESYVFYSISEDEFRLSGTGDEAKSGEDGGTGKPEEPSAAVPEKETVPAAAACADEPASVPEADVKGADPAAELPGVREDEPAKPAAGEAAVSVNIENIEISVPVETSVSAETVRNDLMKMIGNNKLYCACAYLLTLSQNKPENKFYSAYSKLAYAVNDPAFECRWTSLSVMNVFEDTDEALDGIEDELYLSAALRMLFYNFSQTDYEYPQLSGMVKAAADCIGSEMNILINELNEFRKKAKGVGIDAFANYRIGKQLEFEKNIKASVKTASEYYNQYILSPVKEKIKHARFLKTKKMIVDRNSDLATCLKVVTDDKRDMIEFVEDFMSNNKFSTDENKITSQSISDYIDFFWNKAGDQVNVQHKSSDLVSSARNNLYHLLESVLGVIRSWIYYTKILSDDKRGGDHEKEKKNISVAIENALKKTEAVYKSSRRTGLLCVLETLRELKSRMDGSYSEAEHSLFYVDFLKYEKVMLDENYLPYNDNNLTRFLDGFSLSDRIIAHSELPDRDIEERLDEIFPEKGTGSGLLLAEDYGCASLILSWLETQGKESKWTCEMLEENTKYALDRLEGDHDKFIKALELAQSYGKIDDIDTKDLMLKNEDLMHNITSESCNFGYYKRFQNACEEFINKTAVKRGEVLGKKIEALKETNKDSDDERIHKLISKAEKNLSIQNYTAAEDMLNRIERDDLDDYSVDFYTSNSFDLFLNEYDDNYNILKPAAGSGAVIFNPIYSSPKNKEERAANELIRYFPTQSNTDKNKIFTLLEKLNFKCRSVEAKENKINGTAKMFDVTLVPPLSNTKQNYSHPIAPFGSFAMNSGFRVVYLCGKYTPDNLIGIFNSLGAKDCIVLLNYPLKLVERREFARKMKKAAFPNIFITVDPIVIRFLARHYSTTSVNRMLMEVTMPFSYYQPYVSNASQALPVEMFMGRRDQLNDIKSYTGANIVYGGRQLGKTALLQMAKNEIDKDENNDRAVYVTAKGLGIEKTAERLSSQLVTEKVLPAGSETDDWAKLCGSIDKCLRDESKPIPYLLILIDEADTFIDNCKAVDYDPLTKLEELQINGSSRSRFKFVIAGLRNVVRFEKEKAQSNNSVLARFKSLNISPLNAGEARELLEIPLRYLGINFTEETENLINNILYETNYFPGLIHTYCAKLVEAMKENDYAGYNAAMTPPYNVNEDHIKKVLADPSFKDDVADKLTITLKLGDDNYYYIIALILAFCSYTENETGDSVVGFTAEHIYNMGREYEVKKFDDLSVDKITALMDEMCELNVLTYKKAFGTYMFARHNFINLLGKQSEVENSILKYSEEV